MTENDFPPYNYILVIGYQPDIYKDFKERLKNGETNLKLLKVGYPTREEIEYLHSLKLTSNKVHIINETKEMDVLKKHAREIYE